MSSEFNRKYAGRFFSKYRGVVVDATSDPEKLGRIHAKCPVVLGEETLPLALPSPGSGGSVNSGELRLPKKNDMVWIEFEEGDPSRPIWSPGPWFMFLGQSSVPKHSQGEPDATDYCRRNYGNIPPSQFKGSYGNVRCIGERSAGFLEIDDTPGSPRVQLGHVTGTRVEFLPDGSSEHVTVQSKRVHIGASLDTEIIGKDTKFVGGDLKRDIQGDCVENVKGNYHRTFHEGHFSGLSSTLNLESSQLDNVGGNWNKSVVGQVLLQSGGQFTIQGAQQVQVSSCETLELVGMNSNGKNPLANQPISASLVGYNGITWLEAATSTVAGKLVSSYLELSDTGGVQTGVKLGPVTMGSIELGSTPVNNVTLGSGVAPQPLVKGDDFNNEFLAFLIGLQTFLGSITDVAAPTAVAGAKAWLTTLTPLLVKISARQLLSTKVRTN